MGAPKRLQLGIALAAVGLCGALAACAPQSVEGDGQPQAVDAAAASQEADESTEARADAAASWSPSSDCATGHSAEQASLSDAACQMVAHAEIACTTCHADERALAAVHEDASAGDKMPSKLKKTAVDDALCLSCHHETKEALAQATAETTPIADSRGTQAHPHEVILQEQHAELACASCHKLHSSKSMETAAHDQRLSCHHADVFECHTCHE